MGKPLTSADVRSNAVMQQLVPDISYKLIISHLLLFLSILSQIITLPSTQWSKLETSKLAFFSTFPKSKVRKTQF